jgi:hypothetical protein
VIETPRLKPSVSENSPIRPPLAAWTGIALILAPVLADLGLVSRVSVDIPYLDDYDAIVEFLQQFLDEESLGARMQRLLARHNEHVMLTLRGTVVLTHLLRGSLDFTLLNLVGSGFLLLVLLVLFRAYRPDEAAARKLLPFAPAALILIQPQFWMVMLSPTTSLSSFAMTAWAGLALLALRHDSWKAFGAGAVCAALATFSLGNGVLVLPAGVLLLLLRDRPQRALIWALISSGLLALWLLVSAPPGSLGRSLPALDRVLLYSLNFIGSAGAFSQRGLSAIVGALILASAVLLTVRGLPRRNPLLFALLLLEVGSIAANALVRSQQGPGAPLIQPRYRFYSSVLLAVTYLGWSELIRSPRAARLCLTGCLVSSLAFSFFSFQLYRDELVKVSVNLRLGFEYWWKTGEGGLIHPSLRKANGLILTAVERGHLRLPDEFLERQAARPISVVLPRPGRSVEMAIDVLHQDERALVISGWAHFAGTAQGQQVAIVLKSRERVLVFPAHSVARADLLDWFGQPQDPRRFRELADSGFRVVVHQRDIEPGRYRLGLLLRRGGHTRLGYHEEAIVVSRP